MFRAPCGPWLQSSDSATGTLERFPYSSEVLFLDTDPSAKWDAVGSVVGGVSAFIGMAFAATASIVAYRLFKVESDRDSKTEARERRVEAEMRRKQATAIGFWHNKEWDWKVSNHSPLPIYNAGLCVCLDPERGDVWDIMDGASEMRNEFASLSVHEEVIRPDQEVEFRLPSSVGDRVALMFTDNAGVTWLRRGHELFEDGELPAKLYLVRLFPERITSVEEELRRRPIMAVGQGKIPQL